MCSTPCVRPPLFLLFWVEARRSSVPPLIRHRAVSERSSWFRPTVARVSEAGRLVCDSGCDRHGSGLGHWASLHVSRDRTSDVQDASDRHGSELGFTLLHAVKNR